MRAVGEMREWPNGTDSKSVVLATVPRVRIPISPPLFNEKALIIQGFFVSAFLKKIPAHTLAHTLDGSVLCDQRLIFPAAFSHWIYRPQERLGISILIDANARMLASACYAF